jgi:hypothetical protein
MKERPTTATEPVAISSSMRSLLEATGYFRIFVNDRLFTSVLFRFLVFVGINQMNIDVLGIDQLSQGVVYKQLRHRKNLLDLYIARIVF